MADITNTCGTYYPIAEDTYRINSLTIWDIEGGLSLNWAVVYPSPLPPPQVTPPDAEYVEIIIVKASDLSRIAFLTVAYDYPSTDGRYEIELAATGDYWVFVRLLFDDETSSRWTGTKVSYQNGDTGVDLLLKESNTTSYLTIEGMSTEVSIDDVIVGYDSYTEATVVADPVVLSGSYVEGDAVVQVEVTISGTFDEDEDIFIRSEVLAGTNLLTNPGFTTDTDWTKVRATIDEVNGWGVFAANVQVMYLFQAGILENGKKYIVRTDVLTNDGTVDITGYDGTTYNMIAELTGGETGTIEGIFDREDQQANEYFIIRGIANTAATVDNAAAYEITVAGGLTKVEDANVILHEDGRKIALEG